MLLADRFISDLNSHGGVQAPWKFEHVLALPFQNEILAKDVDCSDSIAEMRGRILSAGYDPGQGYFPDDGALRDFVRRATRRSTNDSREHLAHIRRFALEYCVRFLMVGLERCRINYVVTASQARTKVLKNWSKSDFDSVTKELVRVL